MTATAGDSIGIFVDNIEVKVDLLEDRTQKLREERVVSKAIHEEVGLFLKYTETGYWTRKGWKWILSDEDMILWLLARLQWEICDSTSDNRDSSRSFEQLNTSKIGLN